MHEVTNAPAMEALFDCILHQEPNYTPQVFFASDVAMDFVKLLLIKDPEKRITIDGI